MNPKTLHDLINSDGFAELRDKLAEKIVGWQLMNDIDPKVTESAKILLISWFNEIGGEYTAKMEKEIALQQTKALMSEDLFKRSGEEKGRPEQY